MTVYFDCPDNPSPIGGIKQIYRQVDVLRRHGAPAYVVHTNPEFRCTWFENDTPVVYAPEMHPSADDYIVLPESRPHGETTLRQRFPGLRQVIFNQNAYLTFKDADPDTWQYDSPYDDPNTIAIITVSDDSLAFLRQIFPGIPLYRVTCGIDPARFVYSEDKERVVAFVMRKNKLLREVVNGLIARGSLKDYALSGIRNMSEAQVATLLRRASVYLTATTHEGFSLPPAEAMASGCVVVGYDGRGGREYFTNETGFPVPSGEVLTFIEIVEEVLRLIDEDPDAIATVRATALETITTHFGLEQETESILAAWEAIGAL